GFSGRDGRTTIFDYWSLDKMRRWLAGGKPSQANLTDDEIALRNFYMKVLNIARSEAAISEGKFFDLMYVNYESAGMNPHRHFAYLRNHGNETLLIAVNFDTTEADMRINIPHHAFDYLGLREQECSATELLTDRKARKVVSSVLPFTTKVPARGAVIWKFTQK
ncbi:MAG: alpha-amylase, partial [Muribaculaceae bacterium]|nr:alpha-amylase [Muribaculaceae bacterium]